MRISRRIRALTGAVTLAAAGACTGPAHAVAFDVSWTGSAGYSLTGTLVFDDALLGTGAIDESDVTSLSIAGFHNGVTIGTWDWLLDGLSAGASFNFNFNATTETFRTGGAAASPTGQQWNTAICASTLAFGFFSGNATQGFCLPDGSMAGMIPVANSTLLATRRIDIAEPATLALYLPGLAGLGAGHAIRRRRRA